MEIVQSLSLAQLAYWCYCGIIAVISVVILARFGLALFRISMHVIDAVFGVEHNKQWVCWSLAEALIHLASLCLALLVCVLIGIGEIICLTHGKNDGGPILLGILAVIIIAATSAFTFEAPVSKSSTDGADSEE